MNNVYSFNDILRANFQDCSLFIDSVFMNTENEQILGYLSHKNPNDLINGGYIEFTSPYENHIHKICGKNFMKNAKILKIVDMKYRDFSKE
jgi:hypothetical protein